MKLTPLFALLLLAAPVALNAQKRNKKNHSERTTLSDTQFHQYAFRNIGPFRGGRSVAATGVVAQPNTYYMGSTGGGVWKTTDNGTTWNNCSDGYFKTGTVGAIAVAESNPNIVVAGMGEHAARGVMTSMGDGVYTSADAGKTWTHRGLSQTHHISDVIIHPTNPNIIFVAAQGAQYGATTTRGIYKSTDGGANWNKVLYVNNTTGASSLVMDMKNPTILYAAMWDHQRKPYTMISGGEGSGIYKSTDEGVTWNKVQDGLPKVFGKAGISVSRDNPERVFAVIEAAGDTGGVYRSDNAGKTWKQVNKSRVTVARSWYYMEIFADPQNENVVYVLNAPMLKSIDGGVTFSTVATPHGDNHHLWINPNNTNLMINANDGGANISTNGGKTWSTQTNQPTAQFYRVSTDNQVPYHIYGGQQDNSAIGIASRTNGSGITWKDWYDVAGCESAYLAFNPNHPSEIFGGCYQGIIEKWSRASRTGKSIKEYPELALGNVPKDFKYRYNWNAPIVASPQHPNTIYHAGNVVFKSADGGQNWMVISPDLTRNNSEQQGVGGQPFTNEAAGGENYNTIMYLATSSHSSDVLWAGSDDGLVHVTQNNGTTWENVTPKGLPEGIINSIEVSPHNPATAYIVVMRYKQLDLKPYIFKTTDFGKTWQSITNGITGEHTFVRAVREDPVRKDLLYAGTETGLYISYNGGEFWEPFQLNLPIAPINDITIRQNDLIVATAGRSFWILDDLSVLQQQKARDEFHLYTPKDAYLLFGGSSDKATNGLGQNPKQGIAISYYLPTALDSVTLELNIKLAEKTIRTYHSKKTKAKTWAGGPPKEVSLSTKKGINTIYWDFKRNPIPGIDSVFVYGDYSGSRIGPGTYTISLSVENENKTTEVQVLPNPAIEATPEEYSQQQTILNDIAGHLTDIHTSVTQLRTAKAQLRSQQKTILHANTTDELLAEGKSILMQIDDWEKTLIQPSQKTFQDVINFNNQLNAEFMHLKSYVDAETPKVTSGALERLTDLKKVWASYSKKRDQILKVEIPKYNSMYRSLAVPAIIIPLKEE